jgi:hypothetical protein
MAKHEIFRPLRISKLGTTVFLRYYFRVFNKSVQISLFLMRLVFFFFLCVFAGYRDVRSRRLQVQLRKHDSFPDC